MEEHEGEEEALHDCQYNCESVISWVNVEVVDLRPTTPRTYRPYWEQKPEETGDALQDPVQHEMISDSRSLTKSIITQVEDIKTNSWEEH